jgi:hypothetical protein
MNEMKMRMGGGTDIAQLAEMIRRMGRGGDKILAHITPEEAVMLKEQGGSGEINPMTGLPEFQEEYDPNMDIGFGPGEFQNTAYYNNIDVRGMPQEQFERFTGEQPMFTGEGSLAPQNFQPIQYGEANMTGSFEPRMSSYDMPDVAQEYEMAAQQAAEPSAVGGRQVEPVDENIFDRAERGLQRVRSTLDRYPTLTRVGGAGANLVAQALLARRANRAREAEAGRLRERAQPFRAAEQEAMSRARGDGLTPQQARQMEIDMATARSGLSAANRATGSAASGILSGQMNRARSTARQENLETALQLAGIADRYERQAIQEELARDQELAQLFASVIGKEIEAASRTQAPQGEK